MSSVSSSPTTCALLARASRNLYAVIPLVCAVLIPADCGICSERSVVILPADVRAVWDLEKAYHLATPTRERICLNGLWQWQPADARSNAVPSTNWGYFKVPGCWPGITDYLQKDCQTVYAHPSWSKEKLAALNAAWYQREFTVPQQWAGRRISLSVDYLNSYAAVYLDGHLTGETRFPGGEVELSSALTRPGAHQLSLLVIALPLKAVMLSYTDSASAREQKGAVERRGLCGDVFLVSIPSGPRLSNLRVETSVRKKELAISCTAGGLMPEAEYSLKAKVMDGQKLIKEFLSNKFRAKNLAHDQGVIRLAEAWIPQKLWDIHTPQNIFQLEVSLLDARGGIADTTWPASFGFRELWIDGRDFVLNGTRMYLSAVPLDNAQVSAGLATYAGARESLERLKGFGINFVYTHNYGCEPGAHLSFEEILKAADDVGMLVSFSQPHFSHYDWKAPDADAANGYATHAAYYVRVAQNHPSVVMYSMSHNATGYDEDMNPDLIDGIHEARDAWALKNVALARRAEEIVHRLDPGRIVYHHASGNLSSMHAINFYPNFVPIQELSDWFEHWSTAGVKPAFMCEYGAPFTWDWTMYRGWYKGQREFGSAAVPWEFCLAEWNAQFLGDRAFAVSEAEKKNLRWEAEQFRAGKLWHRWDYPVEVGSSKFDERYPVFAMYLKDNWRAFRTWGVSAISPWEFEHFWKLREGVDRGRRVFQTDWQNLQRPGFSPDYEEQRYERMDLAYERSDWIPTAAAQTLIANNRPLLAYLAGKPGAFTSKDHVFQPAETVRKQLIIINNSREKITAQCEWRFQGSAISGSKHLSVAAGQQARVPITFRLPAALAPGSHLLTASVKFNTGEKQSDTLVIDLIATPAALAQPGKLALFDPQGETAQLLANLGLHSTPVASDADLSLFDTLIVGKGALTVDGPAPDISRVRAGLKVILFEQTSEVLEKRFGFRVEEYGLRQVFPRIPDHPALAGLSTAELRDWRGEATILPSRLKYESRPRYGPTVQWCGLTEPHLWRCGNRGNVASVLIEKPSRGDFLPIIDGGFSLQFSPLLEYREGKGLVLFCQLDVTGRTETDPAANLLVRNLLRHVGSWAPPARRQLVYAGDLAGRDFLESIGASPGIYAHQESAENRLLVVGSGGERELTGGQTGTISFLEAGNKILSVGLTGDQLNSFMPFGVATTNTEHISGYFPAPDLKSVFAGICPADLHNRAPRRFPLISAGANILGDGVLAEADSGKIVFCQMAPWQFSEDQPNLRRTHRSISLAFSRLLANLGVAFSTPLLERFHDPTALLTDTNRCLTGLYLDTPQEWDDPYRHFRW